MTSPVHFAESLAARFCLILFVVLIALCVATMVRAAGRRGNRSRADVEQAIVVAEQAFAPDPRHAGNREQLARLLYESGDFPRAAALLASAVDSGQAQPSETLLAAETEYLLGHYARAEQLFQKLLADTRADKTARTKATVGLGFVYYQTNRFDRFSQLEFGIGVEFPAARLLRSFDAPPYQVEWPAGKRLCEVPLSVVDPLPALTVSYDGREAQVLFDTGADMCIVDSELAKQLGIKEEGWTLGGFGGGKIGRLGYGKLRSLAVGEVVVRNVPVWVMPTQRFSSIYPDGKTSLGGIIGTGLIRQFLATLDYQRGKFVLRQRSADGQRALRAALSGHSVTEVPFALHATHWMMARGALDDRRNLTFFIDSGLASDAAFSAPPQTLLYAGIPQPKVKRDPRSPGGGGGAWSNGTFAIRSLALGPLVQHDLVGEFGAMPASTYWQNGFIQDGLLSHRFLRQYASWSIDFDRMQYVFAQPARNE